MTIQISHPLPKITAMKEWTGESYFVGRGCTPRQAYEDLCRRKRLGMCLHVEEELRIESLDDLNPECVDFNKAKQAVARRYQRAGMTYDNLPDHLRNFGDPEYLDEHTLYIEYRQHRMAFYPA